MLNPRQLYDYTNVDKPVYNTILIKISLGTICLRPENVPVIQLIVNTVLFICLE